MDERHLLLLGLLMIQSQHGYRINEFIDHNLGRVSGMKKATAYALLERLHGQGLVEMSTESDGNHPPRKVYTITPAGRARFVTLLERLLGEVERYSTATDIALIFLDHLPREQALAVLTRRRLGLQELAEALARTPKHEMAAGVELTVQRKRALIDAELAWLAGTIANLQA